MIDFAFAERLVDVVAGSDEEGGGKDKCEDCEGCGVEDAEKWDVRAIDLHVGGLGSIVLGKDVRCREVVE